MNATVEDLTATIVPKSDQLNADQLLGGPLTITVTSVGVVSGDQPIAIHYEGDNGRPYKPCLTMRKLLVYAWGKDGNAWAGRAMTLYNDPDIKFGGELVGGIRISHLSDIAADIKVSLTTTRGKKAMTAINRMERPTSIDYLGLINAAADLDELKEAYAVAYRSTDDQVMRKSYTAAKDARKAALTPQDAPAETA